MVRSRTETGNVVVGFGIWAILLVFTALLAFSPDVGVPGVLDAMNVTEQNFADKIAAITNANLEGLCTPSLLDGNSDCPTAARNFRDELKSSTTSRMNFAPLFARDTFGTTPLTRWG